MAEIAPPAATCPISAGVNPVAIWALLIGIAPNVPGFLRSVRVLGGGPDGWDAIYPCAWFTGFIVAAVLYRRGTRGPRFGGRTS